MTLEFIVFDGNGNEVERIDPVIDFVESKEYWRVDNGYHVYTVKKQAGYSHQIRVMEGAGNDS